MQLGLENHKMIQAVKTRWNSTYFMLKRIMEQREALISVLSDRTVTTRIQAGQLMLTEDEWTIVENLVKILEPFEMVTTLLSSETQPTVSMVMPIFQTIKDNFISRADEDEPEDIKQIKNVLLHEFQSRFKNIFINTLITGAIEIQILDLSTFLDPRFKNKERFLGSLFKTKR